MPPWIRINEESPLFEDGRGEAKFILDNDIDLAVLLPWLQGRLGLSVVPLPDEFRDASDEEVLAEARRQDRILLTHDRRFLNRKSFAPEDNPGVIIIPGGSGDVSAYLGLIGIVTVHISQLRHAYNETVLALGADGSATLWNYDRERDVVEPISIRVGDEEYPIEVWLNEEGQLAQAPTSALGDESEN